MSYFYKYDFVSPEPIYATVKEELKSYFDTGACDDLMFPTYLNKCLEKMGKSSYTITNEILDIEDFTCRLPDNFYAVREAWACVELPLNPYQSPNSFYSQSAKSTTIQVSPYTTNDWCPSDNCTDPCDEACMPSLVQVVYKTNNEIARSLRREYLLKPGNISVRDKCDVDYSAKFNSSIPYASTYGSFDIRGNKFVTNFRNGVVHLIFYATDYDEFSNQMIPDNYRVREYIEAFLKYKVFETLTNQVHDETFNQLMQKLVYYKSLADEAYIMAESELKKETAYDKQRKIKNLIKRNRKYELPVKTSSTYWRRNGG
jgi:hypothetical protein